MTNDEIKTELKSINDKLERLLIKTTELSIKEKTYTPISLFLIGGQSLIDIALVTCHAPWLKHIFPKLGG